MSPLDREVLAERVAAIERHLQRVASRLPPTPDELEPATDAEPTEDTGPTDNR